MADSAMKDIRKRYGDWALVAGAAGGIGAAFSETLAQKGMNLVMIDKDQKKLAQLSNELHSEFGIQVIEMVMDLSSREAARDCINTISALDCRLMIYIPAYSPVKPFLQNRDEELDLYLDLNSRTPLQLVSGFLRSIEKKQPAGIILMASLAGLIGPLWSGPYGATKAFTIVLAESLFAEFHDQGIDILACCAGITDTPTFLSSNPKMTGSWPGVSKPERVAETALKKLGKQPMCIPGWKNRVSCFFLQRIFTRKRSVKFVADAMRKIYADPAEPEG